MFTVFENLTQKQADLCVLVLSASRVPCRIMPNGRRWDIRVAAADYQRARAVMDAYFSENQASVESMEASPVAIGRDAVIMSLVICLGLVLAHLKAAYFGDTREIIHRFGASAAHILDGDYYRTVTALMLHADDAHLLGNMAGLFIFGTAICAVSGWGAGWLMILASGISGNMINAWMYESAHVSIGASTAVFGAVGILAGFQGVRYKGRPGRIRQVLVPLGCGFALLGLLGSGGKEADVRVDIMAHLFGFVAGLFIGAGYGGAVKKIPGKGFQWLCAAAVSGIVFWAWWTG